MKDVKKLLGLRIKEIRKSRKMTQEQLSEGIGIEPNNLSRIEIGKNYPTPENLAKIADVLGVDVHELFIFNHLESIDKIREIINARIEKDDDLARMIFKFCSLVK